ncbi:MULTISPECIES: hypothetical protein [unclassified Caballeronia]|uniref:hypothetical protein n=1 Tax=unclassified Caballeronia TaxID=2646786 RepID=UPI00285A096D|nr:MULTISPECIES: hypothetical protein [unclassified Caballeronia]MDR5738341.1 hypothetical protein [Caballeronia sp. LZ016]MDR5811803.1 hypothetical protein [Caballeronia sp. LZ019]
MRKKRLLSRDSGIAQPEVPALALGDAFAAAAEALALFCRLRRIEAADMPARDVDALLDIAFEEAAQQAAARSNANADADADNAG